MDKAILEKVKELRLNKGLKQATIASMLNISQPAYSRLERGDREFRLDQLKRIVEICGHELETLFDENERTVKATDNGKKLITEIQLLHSILRTISSEIDVCVFHLLHGQYHTKYEVPQPFADYLRDKQFGPEYAVQELTDFVQSILEARKRGDKITGFEEWALTQFEKQTTEWLDNFVRNEDNYEAVLEIVGGPYSVSSINELNAFKDLLDANLLVRTLFQFGLSKDSWFNLMWKKYQDGDMNLAEGEYQGAVDGHAEILIPRNSEGKEDTVRKIHERMKQILS